jgi:hypothetical protein
MDQYQPSMLCFTAADIAASGAAALLSTATARVSVRLPCPSLALSSAVQYLTITDPMFALKLGDAQLIY